jgi:hypothetical protein
MVALYSTQIPGDFGRLTSITLRWKLMAVGKHSSFLQYGNYYGRKKFYSTILNSDFLVSYIFVIVSHFVSEKYHAFSKMTFIIMTFSIMTLSITTLIIMGLSFTRFPVLDNKCLRN